MNIYDHFKIYYIISSFQFNHLSFQCFIFIYFVQMIPVESRAFTVSSHASQAFHQMSEMRDQNILCDIVLCVGMKEFRAHRIVLAGCSPYLKAMFTNGKLIVI